jgi:hypothetical protein
MAGCGRLVCLEEGCTRPSWSGGLCRPCYERTLRSWHNDLDAGRPQQTGGNGDGFDRRFIPLFRNVLEEFGEPVFPEIRWFNALNFAASEYERLGPIVELPPLHGNYQKSSGSDKLGPGHYDCRTSKQSFSYEKHRCD